MRKKSRLLDCATAPVTVTADVDIETAPFTVTATVDIETAPKDNVVFTPLIIVPKTNTAPSNPPPVKAASAKASFKDYFTVRKPPKKEAPLITCDDCEFTARSMRSMVCHYNAHHPNGMKDQRFSCFHCARVFKSKSHITRHILDVHLAPRKYNEKAVTCDICRRSCASEKMLRRHFRLHHSAVVGGAVGNGSGPKDKFNCGFCCDICGRGYEKQLEMLAHRDVYHASSLPISWPAFQKVKHKMTVCANCQCQYRVGHFCRQHSCISQEESALLEKCVTELLRAQPHFRCNVCSFSSVWKVVLRQHWEKAHADAAPIDWDELAAVEVPYYCVHCYQAFDEQAQLATHLCVQMELDSRPKLHTCTICDVSFQRRWTYLRHCQIRHGIFEANRDGGAPAEPEKPKTPIQCPYCETAGKKRASMVAHIKEVHNIDTESPFICAPCDKVFQRKAALDEHNLMSHPKDEKMSAENERILRENQTLLNGEVIYHCSVCSRNYDYAHRFLVHYRLHFVERQYVCHLCGKQTRTQNNLMMHIKSFHLNIREYECDLCGKGFCSKVILEQHRRIHTGERPYACEICGKTFYSKSALQSHKKFHNDFFPHKCHLCPKQFKIRRCLTNHIRVHTGERPFKCELCFKTYSDPSRFSYHKKVSHSDERRVECKVCGKRYKANKFLYRHMKSHQTEILDTAEETL